ncbi:hypothetical protein L4D76_15610 [Photobacterium sagamiensis]|uniref:hypothetical protein n=1 Tax=Photobacterium sagamiensis TaxID=2910241 RepID=UPI003D0A3A50
MKSGSKPSIKEGKSYETKHYGTIVVVEYLTAKKVLVRFKRTGTEKWTSAYNIRSGMGIRDPKQPYGIEKKDIPDDMQTGTVHNTNVSGQLIIEEYKAANDVRVKFIDTGYRESFSSGNIRKGAAYDPMAKRYYNVGFIGIGRHKTAYVTDNPYLPGETRSPAYDAWSGILKRCYCPKSLAKRPTYSNVKVDKIWHNFQNFADWFEKQDWRGKAVDKDLLALGVNKVYSPDRCVMLSKRDNSMLNTLGYIKLVDKTKTSGKCRIIISKTYDEFDDAIEYAVQNELALRASIFKKINKVDPLDDPYRTIKTRIIKSLKEQLKHD